MKTNTDMAREAGASLLHGEEYALFGSAAIDRLIELARADEREACAKVCDDAADNVGPIEFDIGASLAAAIRARGNT